MRSRIKKKLLGISKSLSRKRGDDIEHVYPDFSILLPAGHLLPTYQEHHPSYDRFLPHLARYIDESSTIIDVGANCGDTLAAMAATNPKSTYICIEPDDVFFRYLTSNIERIKEVIPGLDVKAVKSLVGKNIGDVMLHGTGGTKHAVVGAGNRSARSLDELLQDSSCPPIKLIKTDVDGFDYDVMDSAEELLKRWHPILFFECQYEFEYQKEGFKKTIAWLKVQGYGSWTIFDNFGEMMVKASSIEQIFQLMEYVWRQNQKMATRTTYYFDILAATDLDASLVDEVLGEYRK